MFTILLEEFLFIQMRSYKIRRDKWTFVVIDQRSTFSLSQFSTNTNYKNNFSSKII